MDHPSVIILAAGNSERMGKPKHLLPFSEEDTFIEHIIKVYQKTVISKMIVVVNDSFPKQQSLLDNSIQIVVNSNPELGRFHSIRLGLKEVNNTPVFIQNIDNPFVNAGLLMQMQMGLTETDFAVPVYNGKGGHPILFSSQIIHPLINNFSEESNLNVVLKSFKRKDVIVQDPYIHVNINTREEYRKYFLGG